MILFSPLKNHVYLHVILTEKIIAFTTYTNVSTVLKAFHHKSI